MNKNLTQKQIQDMLNVEKLLLELEDRKSDTKKELDELKKFKESVKESLNIKFDYRNKHIYHEKVDVVSRFYDLILKFEREISSIIKDQISLIIKNKELLSERDRITGVAMELVDLLNKNIDEIDETEDDDISVEEYLSEIDEEFKETITQIKQNTKEAKNAMISKPSNDKEVSEKVVEYISKYDFERKDLKKDLEKNIQDAKENKNKLNDKEKEKIKIEEKLKLHQEYQKRKEKINIFLD